jgi:hypothetical protein
MVHRRSLMFARVVVKLSSDRLCFAPTYPSSAPVVSLGSQALLRANQPGALLEWARLALIRRVEINRVVPGRFFASLEITFPYSRAHLYASPQDVTLTFSFGQGYQPSSALCRRFYARFCIRTSENSPSTHSGEYGPAATLPDGPTPTSKTRGPRSRWGSR